MLAPICSALPATIWMCASICAEADETDELCALDCSALVELLTTDAITAFEEGGELADSILVAPHLLDPEFLSAMRRRAILHPEEAPALEQVTLEFLDGRGLRLR